MIVDNGDENIRAASLVIEELTRNDVCFFVLSPGSRSTPLTVAVARNENAESIIHFDERGAAFFALGHARATGCPVALVCTSGTAVANYLPAVVEASQEMLPLILLTADRPPELRDCGANQTIDQVDIFGRHVRYSVDLPCPEEKTNSDFWRQTIDDAMQGALGSPGGPVHLNFQFREPLTPSIKRAIDKSEPAVNRADSDQRETVSPSLSVSLVASDMTACLSAIEEASNLVMIAGHLRNDDERRAALTLAGKLGCPVLADIRSGLRGRTDGSHLISLYDTMLTAGVDSIIDHTTTLLQIGSRLVSKSLLQQIEKVRPQKYVQIDSDPRNLDPTHSVTDRIVAEIAEFCRILAEQISSGSRNKRSSEIASGQSVVSAALAEFTESESQLSEPLAALVLANNLPAESIIYAANSMPVRLLERYVDRSSALTIYANRGASGIDGTVASAAGLCAAVQRRVTLFCGDLAVLHDLNSLRLMQQLQLPMTLVVINNDGGGIFDRLPIRQHDDVFEKYFITPHGMTFEKAAGMFNISYVRPGSASTFVAALHSAHEGSEPRFIELCIDREVSLDAEQRILRLISKRTR